MIQRRLKVQGRVQGVGFRIAAARFAHRLTGEQGRLQGYVRNLPDGSVEVVVLGEKNLVEQLVEWCRHGPSSAEVVDLEVIEEAPDTALPPFDVRR